MRERQGVRTKQIRESERIESAGEIEGETQELIEIEKEREE